MADPEEDTLPPPPPPAPLILDQAEARRAEKHFLETGLPPLSQGLGDRAPLLPLLISRSGSGTNVPSLFFSAKFQMESAFAFKYGIQRVKNVSAALFLRTSVTVT